MDVLELLEEFNTLKITLEKIDASLEVTTDVDQYEVLYANQFHCMMKLHDVILHLQDEMNISDNIFLQNRIKKELETVKVVNL